MVYEMKCATCGEEITTNSVYVGKDHDKLVFLCVGEVPSSNHPCIKEYESLLGHELDGGIQSISEIGCLFKEW